MPTTMTIRRILVGIDGSPNSHRALLWATALATSLDAELVVVHAVGLLEHLDSDDHEPNPAPVGRAGSEQFADIEATDGLRARLVIEDGSPEMVLLRLADREVVDLIVVGRRGTGGAHRMPLGSTSAHIADSSPVPVVIVPGEAPTETSY